MGQHCFNTEHLKEARPSRKICGQRRGAPSRLSQSSVNCSKSVAGLTTEANETPVNPTDLMFAIAPFQYAGFLFSMFHYDDLVLFVDA